MNHDISHCNGQDCKKKEQCYRYELHLHARKKNMFWVSYINPKDCIENDYVVFLERK